MRPRIGIKSASRRNFLLVPHILDALDYFGLQGLAVFEQFFNALGIGLRKVRNSLKIARLSRGQRSLVCARR